MKNILYTGESNNARKYFIGFILSIILTLVTFMLVGLTHNRHDYRLLVITIGFSILQIIIHLICFLHISGSQKNRWNLLALIFSIIIIAILVGGSLWIMCNLNYMMKNNNANNSSDRIPPNY
ncbi:MAG: cytochrome o ubiquinol oxidase subunit IV [Candidatus Dasytiphilus stammeri]